MVMNRPLVYSVHEAEIRWGRPLVNLVLHSTASSPNATVGDIETFWYTPKCPRGGKCEYIPNVQGGMGWSRPGYHYLIDRSGKRHILAKWDTITWGVRGYNKTSIHIGWIGGRGGVDNRTRAQKAELKRLVKEIQSIIGYPLNIVGHRDLSPDLNNNGIIEPHEFIKLCPSFDVQTWLKEEQLM